MFFLVDGERVNTSTSLIRASWHSENDVCEVAETLYSAKKKTGNREKYYLVRTIRNNISQQVCFDAEKKTHTSAIEWIKRRSEDARGNKAHSQFLNYEALA